MKFGIIALAVSLIISSAVFFSNLIISSRPLLIQNNTGVDGRPVNNISVSATGKINVKPDIATFNVGYQIDRSTLTAVQTEMTNKSNALSTVIKALGVDENDIQTVGFSVNPQTKYDETSNTYVPDGFKGVLVISVKVREIGKTGQIIDAAIDAGANTVNNIEYSIDNLEVVKQQARRLAAENAKVKADALAAGSGVTVGTLISISENSSTPYYINYSTASMDKISGSNPSTPTVNTGSLDIEVSISAVYAIK